ncbi:hypothetical protein [Streptomyces sp. NPDC048650]|uniref:hypothetical protein n=1 Tax=unclassified Streptomyces TaxID=2593676 RepID=UPI00370FD2F7
MGQGFQINPDAIFHCASGTDQQKEAIPRIARALEHVEIPSGAFGKLPESDELLSAYKEHATAAQENVHDLVELLEGAVEALRATAGNYVAIEHELESGFSGNGGGA